MVRPGVSDWALSCSRVILATVIVSHILSNIPGLVNTGVVYRHFNAGGVITADKSGVGSLVNCLVETAKIYGTGNTAAKRTKLGLVWANRPQPQLIEQRNKSHVAI